MVTISETYNAGQEVDVCLHHLESILQVLKHNPAEFEEQLDRFAESLAALTRYNFRVRRALLRELNHQDFSELEEYQRRIWATETDVQATARQNLEASHAEL